MKVLGISGSLRKGSYNTMALHAAQALAPAGMQIEIADISLVPLYNEDVRSAGLPEAVRLLRDQVRAADALLFVTPEYNFSIPGVLKNAIDWVSRPPEQPIDGKPAAIMGVTTGLRGTTRMQYHLRQVLGGLNAFTLNKPEVFISHAASHFTAEGELTDAATRQGITDLLVSLQKLVQRLG